MGLRVALLGNADFCHKIDHLVIEFYILDLANMGDLLGGEV